MKTKTFFLCLAMIVVGMAARAASLEVLGHTLSTGTATYVSDGAITSGQIYYDGSSSIFLRNVKISGTSKRLLYNSRSMTVYVYVEGTCEVTTTGKACVRIDDGTVNFMSYNEGTLAVTNTGSDEAFYLEGGALIFKNLTYCYAKSTNNYGIRSNGGNGTLTFSNSFLEIDGSDGAVYNFKTNPVLTNSMFVSPHFVKDGSVKESHQGYDKNVTKETVYIAPTSQFLGFYVAGFACTRRDTNYKGDKIIPVVSYHEEGSQWIVGVASDFDIDPLRFHPEVERRSPFYITSNKNIELYSPNNHFVSGGVGTVEVPAMFVGTGSTVTVHGDLELKGTVGVYLSSNATLNVNNSADFHIHAGKLGVGSDNYTGNLNIDGAYFYVNRYNTNANFCAIKVNQSSVDHAKVYSPENSVIVGHGVYQDPTTTDSPQFLTNVSVVVQYDLIKTFPIYILGKQVNNFNYYKLGNLVVSNSTYQPLPFDAITYNAATNTLKIKNYQCPLPLDPTTLQAVDKPLVKSSVEDLNVVIGDNSQVYCGVSTSAYDSNESLPVSVFDFSANTTLKGATTSSQLRISGNQCIRVRDGNKLTIDGLTIAATGVDKAISGYSRYYNEENYLPELILKNCTVRANVTNSGDDSYSIGFFKNMKGYQAMVTSPTNVIKEKIGKLYYLADGESGELLRNVTISPHEIYMKVFGETVTADNSDNIVDGASYDELVSVLDISDVQISDHDIDYVVNAILQDEQKLTIKINGINDVYVNGDSYSNNAYYGSFFFGREGTGTAKVDICGDGILNVTSNSTKNRQTAGFLLTTSTDVTIRDCQLWLAGGTFLGNYTPGKLTIDNADIYIWCDKNPCVMQGIRNFEMINCHVAEPRGAVFMGSEGNNFFYGDDQALVKEMHIVRGDVATGLNNMEAKADDGDGLTYDLEGRRVQTMQPGHVYLVRKGGAIHKVVAQ